MNVFTNTNKFKKLIVVLVFLLLFNFCYPTTVRAGDTVDYIVVGAGKLFFTIFDGVLKILNSIFTVSTTSNLLLTPENIIKGKFVLMEANIFKDISSSASLYIDANNSSNIKNGRIKLREIISGWYYALRNFAIVALLSVLVYVSIRMIISTVSADKAKYKMMFKDWLVALCLVFAAHYIMVGILNLSNLITEAIGTSGRNSTIVVDVREKIADNLEEALATTDEWDTDDSKVFDLVGDAFGYICVYAGIIVFTIIFAVKYIIRALTIMFLILLAPISCITYPIDKLGDGKSQAFNFWFREFFLEVIIQPFHLLLYVVLIGASTQLAETNAIYSILCFAIMLPAEKFIKQMFGINDKLGSPLASFASGAAMSSIARNAAKALGGKGGSGKGSGGSGSDSNPSDNLPPRERGSLDDYDDGRETLNSNNRGNNNHNNSGNSDNHQSNGSNQLSGGNENSDNNNEPHYLGDGQNGNDDESANEDIPEERDIDTVEEPELDESDEGGDIDTVEEPELDESDEGGDVDTVEEPESDGANQGENIEANTSETPELEQQSQGSNTPIRRQARPVRTMQAARNAMRAEIARDVRKKFGTTSAKGLAKKALKTVPRTLGKGVGLATRLTLAAGAAGFMGIAALATGNPKAIIGAITAGAALGNAAGKRINGVRTDVNGRIGRYVGKAWNDAAIPNAISNSIRKKMGKEIVPKEDYARIEAKNRYLQDQKERDYVTQKLKDENGTVPSYRQVNAEMEERWKYREAGITDRNVIDGARSLDQERENLVLEDRTDEQRGYFNNVEERLRDDEEGHVEGTRYRDAYEQLNRGEMTSEKFDAEFGEGAAEQAIEHQNVKDTAARRANQSLFAASIADQYKAADFRDEKKMKQLQETYVHDFMQTRSASGRSVSREYATEVVNSAINDAAKIRGLKSGANFGEKNTTTSQSQTTSNNNQSNNSGSSNGANISRPERHEEPGGIPISRSQAHRENIDTRQSESPSTNERSTQSQTSSASSRRRPSQSQGTSTSSRPRPTQSQATSTSSRPRPTQSQAPSATSRPRPTQNQATSPTGPERGQSQNPVTSTTDSNNIGNQTPNSI